MNDEEKSKEQLIKELRELRKRFAVLEAEKVTTGDLTASSPTVEPDVRTALDAAKNAAMLIDPQGTILATNEKVAYVCKKTTTELLARCIHEVCRERFCAGV